jgi:excisionase family DNA binding protein
MQKKVLNLKEFSEYCGLSRSTIWKLTADKKIPHYKLNRLILFKIDEVDEWLTSNKIDAV